MRKNVEKNLHQVQIAFDARVITRLKAIDGNITSSRGIGAASIARLINYSLKHGMPNNISTVGEPPRQFEMILPVNVCSDRDSTELLRDMKIDNSVMRGQLKWIANNLTKAGRMPTLGQLAKESDHCDIDDHAIHHVDDVTFEHLNDRIVDHANDQSPILSKVAGKIKSIFSSIRPRSVGGAIKVVLKTLVYLFALFGLISAISVAMVVSPVVSAINQVDGRVSASSVAPASTQPQTMEQAASAVSAYVQTHQKVELPKEIEIVTGKSDRIGHRFFVFSDPLCPFCKQFEPVLEEVAMTKGFEMHLYPTPLHEDAKVLVRKIACAKNRGSAWYQSVTTGQLDDINECEAGKDSDTRALAFFQSFNMEGTPTIVNEAGIVHPGGFGSAEEMIKFLESK